MKVLIIGYGSVAAKHHKALLKLDNNVEVVALRSRNTAKEIENVASVYTYNEAKSKAPYTFAIISNPTFKHTEAIEQLLSLNCPLFIEKPLSDTLKCGTLVKEIFSAKVITYVGCNLRFLDSLVYLKEKLLKNLVVNEVNVYCGSFLPEWRPGLDFRNVYSSNAEKGGGVHLDLIHELDYVYWLFGKPVSVSSFKSSTSSLGISAIDYANYLLGYNTFSVNIILNYFRKDKKRQIELVCSDDTYTIDLLRNSITNNSEIVFRSEQTIRDTYFRQMEYFIDLVIKERNQGKMMNDIHEAYEVLKICLK
ncbi:MAG TPA: Gfo/Idh/MocA family oxidoreductase [Desulfobacteraceae bacterium]|nr:Gfo/Idh/MocA family oxidoreductase [Desulfobacteraceae bacterium]HPQ27845.1 Gfo/Idh/MocA family oxidoreductase [Desulfobacteraceae bacterium]